MSERLSHPSRGGCLTAEEYAAMPDNRAALLAAVQPVMLGHALTLVACEERLRRAIPPDDWELYEALNAAVQEYVNETTWAAYYHGRAVERASR